MPPTTHDWDALQGTIAGTVILPGAPSYERVRRPFIARFDEPRPQAVVLAREPEDVAETISLARRFRLRTATRCGGHSFAGYSSTGGVVIDVTPMRSLAVSGGVATVGAGMRIGELYERLLDHDRTVPAGTCSSVGIAGITLGGGLGILGRKYGLTSDHLLGAQVVLADGRMITCDEHHERDLFWALRGAGAGNFGVVTSLVFRTRPAPAMTNVDLAWSYSDAAAVIDAWQAWAPTAPDELTAGLVLTANEGASRPLSVELHAAMLGTESDAATLLDELVVRAGADPSSDFRRHMSYRDTMRHQAGLDAADDEQADETPEGPVVRQGYRVSKSEFFQRMLPAEAITALLENFTNAPTPGEHRGLEFAPWGGAYNRVRADATAFAHRDQLFSLKHAIVVDPGASPSQKQAAHRWATSSWASVHGWGSGRVFPNFPDPDLEDSAGAYYGDNHRRLLRIKARYDPGNFFRYQQSLPLR